jgi:hypothetical protein
VQDQRPLDRESADITAMDESEIGRIVGYIRNEECKESMANRRRSDKTQRAQAEDRPRDQTQERPSETIGDPPQQNQPMQKVASRDDIARRAYDLYQQRGGNDGSDLDDWLKAERDLGAQ